MTRHQKRMLKQAAKQICLHILFIVICFVTLIPILYALSVSLNADNSLVSSDFRFIPKNFTLRNYVAVFTEEPVMLWFKNSMTLAVVTVAISLAAAIPAAYVFSRMRFKGASGIQLVTRIVLPLARPSILVTAVMILIYVWNEYLFATTFMTGAENYTLAAGLYSLQATEMSGSWPIFAAASLVVSLPILIVFFAVQRHMTSGLTAGGVKG